MTGFNEFIGTWRAEEGAPYSSHTFTWELAGGEVSGRWIIEAADSPGARAAATAGNPTRFEMRVGKPWLEDGLLLFYLNDGPFVTEFRLFSRNDAVVGAAVHKLPREFAAPEHRQSIEAHRVRFVRKPEAAV